ncbi:unnamed protein product [Tetraodon nigroviridis]|uniref:(spotted green pufferfish) hypothetical protein n=1 Tax=Tetraodon nigroviridis TaxID=99883 RepID=Q4S2X9_TETNG|nr:unnamed protein product [Tetraodon nigroviridis]
MVSEYTRDIECIISPAVETDPYEAKKSKKKAKQAAKETKPAAGDGKEPEEGTWETKVSNKEKREQRKKDKSSSDGSASPGGGDTPVSTPPEQPKTTAAPAPTNQKKKKGESAKVKTEKAEAVVPQEPVRDLPWIALVFGFPQMAARSTPVQTGTPLLRCGATMKTPLQQRLLSHRSFSLSPPELPCDWSRHVWHVIEISCFLREGDAPEKEAPPAPTKKQPVQEKPAAVPPAKAAAAEVTTLISMKLLGIQSALAAHSSCIHANVALVTVPSPNRRNR